MKKVFKKRAPSPSYISSSQLTMAYFQSPFEQQLNPQNRWVVLSGLMPWDEVYNLYLKNVGISQAGRPPLSPREHSIFLFYCIFVGLMGKFSTIKI
jgi:hypothetical protein